MNLISCPSTFEFVKDIYPLIGMGAVIYVIFMVVYYILSKILNYERGIIAFKENIKELIFLLVLLLSSVFIIEFFSSSISSKLFVNTLSPLNIKPFYIHDDVCLFKNAEEYLKTALIYSYSALKDITWLNGQLNVADSVRITQCAEPLFCIGNSVGLVGGSIVNGQHTLFSRILSSAQWMLFNAVTTNATQIVILHIFSSDKIFILLFIGFIFRAIPFTKYIGNIMFATFLTFGIIFPFVIFLESFAFPVNVDNNNIPIYVAQTIFQDSRLHTTNLPENYMSDKFSIFITYGNKKPPHLEVESGSEGMCLKLKGTTIACSNAILKVTYNSFISSVFTLSMNLIIMIVSIKSISQLLGERDSIIDLFLKVM